AASFGSTRRLVPAQKETSYGRENRELAGEPDHPALRPGQDGSGRAGSGARRGGARPPVVRRAAQRLLLYPVRGGLHTSRLHGLPLELVLLPPRLADRVLRVLPR